MGQITFRIDDKEHEKVGREAAKVQMDLNPYAKHLVLNRGQPKVTTSADSEQEISRLKEKLEDAGKRETELQHQLDVLQQEKSQRGALEGLGALPQAKTVAEQVAEAVEKIQTNQKLKDYEKLQKEHERILAEMASKEDELSQEAAERERAVGRLAKIETYGPSFATFLGSIVLPHVPIAAAQQLAKNLNAFGGIAGLPAGPSSDRPGESEDLSPEDEARLAIISGALDVLSPDAAAEFVQVINTVRDVPRLVPYLVRATQQALPLVMPKPADGPAGAPQPVNQ